MNNKTKRRLTLSILLIAGLGIAACEKNDQKDSESQKESSNVSEVPDIPSQKPSTPSQTPGITTAIPGTLRTIMADLGTEMNKIQSGLWLEDYELISASAMKIADHPKASDSEKTRIKSTLGDDIQAFAAMDKLVHGDALAVSNAAKSKDMKDVLDKFSSLQKNCVGCHSAFRSLLIAPQ